MTTEAPNPIAQLTGADGYSPHEHRPLKHYALMTAVFGAAFGSAIVAGNRTGRMPERFSAGDLVMMGLTTHKLSRLISKDKITGFVRSPFVRFQRSSGQGEVEEEPRGDGFRFAVGELLVCPYCLAQWVAAALACGYMVDPGTTRFIGAVYSAETVSDFLQLAYHAAEERA